MCFIRLWWASIYRRTLSMFLCIWRSVKVRDVEIKKVCVGEKDMCLNSLMWSFLMCPMGVITHTKARHSLNTLLIRSDTVLIMSLSNLFPADSAQTHTHGSFTHNCIELAATRSSCNFCAFCMRTGCTCILHISNTFHACLPSWIIQDPCKSLCLCLRWDAALRKASISRRCTRDEW